MFRQMFEEKYMRFPEGRAKALTFSYDDGVAADKNLSAFSINTGLKGTFNLNSLLFDCVNWHNRLNEEETFKLYSGGKHEVALHGARHIFMDKVPLPEAAERDSAEQTLPRKEIRAYRARARVCVQRL